MPLTRRQGTVAGYGCFGAAASFAVCALANRRSASPSVFLFSIAASVVAVALGWWLLGRLYLSDPAARHHYRDVILNSSLSTSLAKYSSVGTIKHILVPQSPREEESFNGDPHNFILQKLYDEIGAEGAMDLQSKRLSLLATAYNSANLRDFQSHHLISSNQFRQMFLNDCAACHIFSELTQSFGADNLNFISAGLGNDIMRRADVQPLVDAQFPWINGQATDAITAAGPEVILTVKAIYKSLMDTFGYTTDEVSQIIEGCPSMRTASLLKCLEVGLGPLAESNITRLPWRDQWMDRTHHSNISLWRWDASIGIRYLLGLAGAQSGQRSDLHSFTPVQLLSNKKTITGGRRLANRTVILSATSLQKMFELAVPTTPLLASDKYDGGCPQTNLVAFLIYWEDVLCAHPEIISSSVIAAPLQDVYRVYTNASQAIIKTVSDLEKAASLRGRVGYNKRMKLEGLLKTQSDAFNDQCFAIHQKYAPIVDLHRKGDSPHLNVTCNQQ